MAMKSFVLGRLGALLYAHSESDGDRISSLPVSLNLILPLGSIMAKLVTLH